MRRFSRLVPPAFIAFTAATTVASSASCANDGNDSRPRSTPDPKGGPLETAPPNVPEFKPAFPGQTRAPAVQTKTALDIVELASGFDHPWAVAFLPDKRMLVTEKLSGKLYLVGTDGKKPAAIAGVPPVDGRDQGGLLDVKVSPDFAATGLVYLSYYEPRKGGNGLAVSKAKLSLGGDGGKLEGQKVIFRMEPTLDSTKHAGGRIVFAPDGNLFVTLGERSISEGRVQARDLGSHLGKIVRITRDGAAAPDNPFLGKGARPEIWTLGHRNVLGAALDERGRLWAVEMGPRGGDELNLIERGKDYGWPTIGYGEEYSGKRIHESTQAPGLEQPVYYWDPVISPGGLAIYTGSLFPEWKGNLFVAGLSAESLVRLVIQKDRVVGEERLLREQRNRIRDVTQGPEGALYVLTDETNGRLLRITPKKK